MTEQMNTHRINQTQKPLCAGYTVIELMVTVAIVGVLAAVAAPSLQDSLRRNARESIMLDLASSLNLARSSAVTRGTNASICRSTNQTSCAGSTGADWASGWLVFSDTGTAGTIDGSDSILQIHSALSNAQVAIELSDRGTTSISSDFIQFDNDGFLSNSSNSAVFKFCDPDNISTNSRAIWISNTGRSSLSIDDGDGIHDDLNGNNLVCP